MEGRGRARNGRGNVKEREGKERGRREEREGGEGKSAYRDEGPLNQNPEHATGDVRISCRLSWRYRAPVGGLCVKRSGSCCVNRTDSAESSELKDLTTSSMYIAGLDKLAR